jgi:DNA processing protein
VIDACDNCLVRSHLVAFLAGDVDRLLAPGRAARADVGEVSTETLVDALSQERRAKATAFLREFDAGQARAATAALGIDAVCRHADAYPPDLADLRQRPPVLYASRLELVTAGDPAPVVIGSRRPSEYGRTVAHRLARGLGAAGVTVISGLALGIDAVAHGACLDGGGPTIAVLACGVDVAYPRTNRSLYARIRDAGSVVSEMPPGARPFRWLFPARNRIMAALGRLTVVVEAADRSGTLITADYAADLGRQVAAVPGQVTSPVAAGTNALLRDGAALVSEPQDVLDLLFGVGGREVREPPPPRLEPREHAVLELVARGARLDEIAAETGFAAAALRSALARLELRGLVRRAPSGSYVPAASGR